MSANQCLNSSQSHFPKFITDDRADKTRSTENLSKLCQNCRLIKDELQAQIFTLKDKSHQSFMQVIQVQQLHEEEMQVMKVEHQQEITALRQQITKLEADVAKYQSQVLVMEKNSKHHVCHMEQPSFLIENIEMIECNEDLERKSKLDDSSFDQFNEFVESKFSNQNEHLFFKNKQNQLLKEPKNLESLEKIQKLTLKIMDLETEVESLWQTNQELKKECTKLEANEKSVKNNYDSLYKESKFMADHIRTLANDKFKLERKVKELEKQIKDTKIKGMRHSSILCDDKQSQMSIKINGSGLFNQYDEYDNIRNSSQKFNDQQESHLASHKNLSKSPVPQIMSKQDLLYKSKQYEPVMTKSEMLGNNNDVEMRKSMPNYKKVSHISPTFKKNSVPKVNQSQKNTQKGLMPVVRVQSEEVDKSDFMDEINREIELKAGLLKKSQGHLGFFQQKQRVSSIPQNFRKRSSAM